ncbi:uncharacterized protein LOC106458279 [Limulus polyphemus]|uniref:Uncharacterized protein LOC106458279 n=1 Tax=Limulus polyphemus TaxID=6850 RepID=A0ABM1S9N2_LIMPO|nr:uncharacterized protein LOC106458279 [Limulus polyphemus]XP_022240337.1 uncharacterized protein LOC106458279 [Limulus polyphemus]XP_022240343.1 uncharacterized protein LOC106458279 [Limulus polyphemus]
MQNNTEKILDVTFETYIGKRVPEWKERIKGQQVIRKNIRRGRTKSASNTAKDEDSEKKFGYILDVTDGININEIRAESCSRPMVQVDSFYSSNLDVLNDELETDYLAPLSDDEYAHCLELAQVLKNVADDFEQQQKTEKSASMKYEKIIESADPEELSSEERDVIQKIRSLKTVDIPEIAKSILVCPTKKTLKLTLDYITGMEGLTGYPSIALSFELAAVILAIEIVSPEVVDLVKNVCKTYVLNRFSSWFTSN